MPVPNTIADLNQTAASNSPLGTDTVGPNLDDYLRSAFAFVRQLFDGTSWLLQSVAGVDTITASCAVPFTAYVAGQTFRFVSAGANATNAVTLNINGLGAKNVTKNGTTALVPGDIPAGAIIVVTYDGTRFQITSLERTGRLIKSTVYPAGVSVFNNDPATSFLIVRQGGAGGGGGGAAAAGASQVAPGQGGGAGAYAEVRVNTGFTGGITVTVGTGGNGGAAGANNGANGGQTTFGSIITTPGGIGGQGASAQLAPFLFGSANASAFPTTTAVARILAQGASGGQGIGAVAGNSFNGGAGAPSMFGGGASNNPVTGSAPPAAFSKGSGGAGGVASNSGAVAGSKGGDGVCIVDEYA